MIKKLLIKWFMPSAEDIANTIATGVADFVNSTGKEEAIATFFEKTQKLQKAQQLATKWLSDGKITPDEVEELKTELKPIVEELYAKILARIGE